MDFYKRALELKNETVSHRRFLHKNAEVGLDMPISKEYIRWQLKQLGISPQNCGCGLTATIGSGTPVILLRADMDALPMAEQSGESFASVTNAAHTCGHDLHAAMLLTAAKMLKEQEHKLCGTVKLMFQPAEETLQGCRDMIDGGILQNPTPDAALAFHVGAGNIPVGKFMYNAGGVMMNSADNFCITVRGKGGHGAYPHLAIDPINTAVHIYTALQAMICREANPQKNINFTIGRFCSGDSGNIIPECALMEGSLRTDDPHSRTQLKKRIEDITAGVASVFRCDASVQWLSGAPCLVCDKTFATDMAAYLADMPSIQLEAVCPLSASASEDFANIAEKIPSAMIYLSAGFDDQRGSYTAHNPKVLFNEDVLPLGAAAYTQCAVQWLQKNRPSQK